MGGGVDPTDVALNVTGGGVDNCWSIPTVSTGLGQLIYCILVFTACGLSLLS